MTGISGTLLKLKQECSNADSSTEFSLFSYEDSLTERSLC
jgi:hypothetical protein